jgi:hypothetical protein
METKINPSHIDTTDFTSKSISELVDAARKRATPVYDFNVPPFILLALIVPVVILSAFT